MLNLIGSIILTSYLTLSFKAVERFNIPVLQAIVFNYIFCVITGSVVNGAFPIDGNTPQQPWFWWAGLMGTIFFTLFNILAVTAQKIGVAEASVANKLSLVIPFVASLYLFNESSTALKIAGVVVALIAVFFTCLPSRKGETPAHKHLSRVLLIALPMIIFIMSGLLDTMIKYVEYYYINSTNHNTYLITAFAAAATVGLLTLAFLLITKRHKFDPRSIVAGLVIGVPNYFSIWCLLRVLKQYPNDSSAIIPINNMGIVLFSTVMAGILFKDRLTTYNWVGIGLALGAIALIAFG